MDDLIIQQIKQISYTNIFYPRWNIKIYFTI